MLKSKVMGVLFSNMHDDMLGELTDQRTMGSVPFGGRYRLIDFALSNMVNSGIHDIGIITKSNYQSLMDHIGSGREWDLSRKRGGLSILPPFSRIGSGIYRGRLEALGGISGYIKHSKADYVLMSDCDIIANFNYAPMLEQHIQSGADLTIAYTRQTVTTEQIKDTTVIHFDETKRITDLLIHPTLTGEQNVYMNIALIKKDLLERLINDGITYNRYSFDRDVLQRNLHTLDIRAYHFEGFSEKINCLKGYFNANMQLLKQEVRDELFPRNFPIYTKVRDQVPVKFGLNAKANNSLLADGCIVEGEVENSIIFRGVKIGAGVKVKNSIIMQGTTIGDNANLNYVITDKDVLIKDGRTLMGFVTYPIYIAKGNIV